MDMNRWKLGVRQLIREYWDVNCGNYFIFKLKHGCVDNIEITGKC